MNDFLVLGGDKRSIYLIDEIIRNKKTCSYFAIDEEYVKNKFAKKAPSIKDAVKNSKNIILSPLSSKDGVYLFTPLFKDVILLEDIKKVLSDKNVVFKGVLNTNFSLCKNEINYLKDENFVLKNAVLTAHATIYELISKLNIGINYSDILVTGFGRCSKAICSLLKSMGAKVYVCARRKEAVNEALSLGYSADTIEKLGKLTKNKDAIINTVPFNILTHNILKDINKDCPILDISSYPYGIGEKDAKELNLSYFILPSLPGKFFPKSAGKIIYETVIEISNKMAGDN